MHQGRTTGVLPQTAQGAQPQRAALVFPILAQSGMMKPRTS